MKSRGRKLVDMRAIQEKIISQKSKKKKSNIREWQHLAKIAAFFVFL